MNSTNDSMLEGKIVEWDQARGFGYLKSGRRKLFLHRRDFSEHHKKPEVGDRVCFAVGSDPKGRPCAVHAVHVNDGGRITSLQLVIILALSGLPLFALYRGGVHWMWAIIYIVGISLFTYLIYALDKRRARAGQWRVSEMQLHMMEAMGGWPGAYLAQCRLRHKCSKGGYRFVFWVIVLAYQFAAYDSLQNWQLTRKVSREIRARASTMN